jgi:hypothetical protein
MAVLVVNGMSENSKNFILDLDNIITKGKQLTSLAFGFRKIFCNTLVRLGIFCSAICFKSLTFIPSTIHQRMYPSISDARLTIGHVLARLRKIHQSEQKALAQALQMSYTTQLRQKVISAN